MPSFSIVRGDVFQHYDFCGDVGSNLWGRSDNLSEVSTFSKHKEYEDKSHQNFDYEGHKVIIGDCVQVNNKRV